MKQYIVLIAIFSSISIFSQTSSKEEKTRTQRGERDPLQLGPPSQNLRRAAQRFPLK